MNVTRRRSMLALPGLLLAVAASPAQQKLQKQSRLLVVNRTRTSAEVFVSVRNTWESRGRVSPRASLPLYNVANGQRFRAVWGSTSKLHTVKLSYDRSYGGWQDTLVLS